MRYIIMDGVEVIGKKFNRLLVISEEGKDSSNSFVFKCKCDCGKVVIKRGAHLRAGFIKSCGCLQRENGKVSRPIHGKCKSLSYSSWVAMKFRCENKGHIAYPEYGGRGIKVCQRWMEFKNFFQDMGEREKGMTLDRINCDGNYEPSNCRWASYKQQGNNRRNNVFITHLGMRKTISQWSDFTGIKYSTLKERLNRGWTMEKSLQPINWKGE